MSETTKSCQVSLAVKIKGVTLNLSVTNDSMRRPKFPITTELSIDETTLIRTTRDFSKNDADENPTRSSLTTFSSLIIKDDYSKTIKDDFIDVAIKNETDSIVIEENVLVNSDEIKNEIEFHSDTVDVAIKNETADDVIKEEDVLFNSDVFVCTASDTLYYCYHCDYSTRDKLILIEHIFTHLFKCNLCSHSTFFYSSFWEHRGGVHFNIKSDENVIECEDCVCKTESKCTESDTCSKKTASSRHNKEKLFKCNYNSKRFANLMSHMYKRSGEKPFGYDKCHYRSRQKSNLIQHNKIHVREKHDYDGCKASVCKYSGEKPFSCANCRKKRHLIQDNATHNQEMLFKCNVCNYNSSQAGNLKRHMYKHTGEKPFSCTKCDYKCRNGGNLSRHNKIHAQQKLLKCKLCSFCSNHSHKHSGEEERFSCNNCDYKCRYVSDLSQHSKIHTREKLFKCNFCSYCSTHSGYLSMHMYSHSGDKRFSGDK